MALIRIHEKPNAVPVNASVFILSTQVNGVWYDQKVTWEQLKGLIGVLDDLENYYKKSETYTKTEVNQLIAQIPTFSIEIVQQLPTTDISTKTIYLVPKQTAGTLDYYDEFINPDGTTSGWEWLGKTEIDLSNYYTKAETEAYVKGDGADYIAGTKTFSTLTTTVQNILGAINEVDSHADAAQTDATQALSDASTAQGTANSASQAASAAQGTADNALTAAGNAASAASAAQQTANTAQTTANNMAVGITNTLTPTGTTQKLADVTQNSTTTSIYGDDAMKVAIALTDEQTTAPGNPVTLTTEQSGGAKSAVVTFTPKQSGSGDPSPSNIRPISGWDGLNLTRTGKNVINALPAFQFLKQNYYSNNLVIDETAKTVVFNSTGATGYYGLIQNASPELPTYYNFKENTSYTFIFKLNSTSDFLNIAVSFTDGTNTDSFRKSNRDADGYITYVSPSNKTVRSLYIGRYSGTTTFYYETFCVMEGIHTRSDFEPCNGETHTATFDSTVYGGSYDFVSGEGVGTWVKAEFDKNSSWTRNASGIFYVAAPSGIDDVFMCNSFKPMERGSSASMTDLSVRLNSNRTNINFKMESCDTLEEFLTAINDLTIQVAYLLATPTPISLTPADVNLLKGSNTVWSDANGNVTVGYAKLPNGNLGAVAEYIKKLEARVKALES
jgi:hypothetical protein